jgi:23S rRNA pseudouridine1911/1915/1917 synthase
MCEDKLIYRAAPKDAGRSLESVLRKELELSGSMIKTLKYNGGLLINGNAARTVDLLAEGDSVTVLLNVTDKTAEAAPEDIPLEILYEDKAIIAVNKPSGMVVHTTCLHQSGTLSNALARHLQQQNITGPIHPVSRLDKDTCGVVLFARNGFVQEQLKRQGQSGEFRKTYFGICSPAPSVPEGVIDLPIKRAPDTIMLRTVAEDGARAVTEYRTVLPLGKDMALVQFILHTGRTHQIRVHTAYLGFPLIGDNLYGGRQVPELQLSGQALFAGKMSFTHPVTKEKLCIEAPKPDWWPGR